MMCQVERVAVLSWNGVQQKADVCLNNESESLCSLLRADLEVL